MRDAIQQAEAQATPVINSLSDALAAYEVERAKFEGGLSNQERMTLVAQNLDRWVSNAKLTLVSFQAAFSN